MPHVGEIGFTKAFPNILNQVYQDCMDVGFDEEIPLSYRAAEIPRLHESSKLIEDAMARKAEQAGLVKVHNPMSNSVGFIEDDLRPIDTFQTACEI